MHIVAMGRNPEPLDDDEMRALQFAVESSARVEPWPFVASGVRVRLSRGPLAGLEGVLIEDEKQQRIVVELTALKRSVAVEIEHDWLYPITCSAATSGPL